jgi:hypothetical protein
VKTGGGTSNNAFLVLGAWVLLVMVILVVAGGMGHVKVAVSVAIPLPPLFPIPLPISTIPIPNPIPVHSYFVWHCYAGSQAGRNGAIAPWGSALPVTQLPHPSLIHCQSHSGQWLDVGW